MNEQRIEEIKQAIRDMVQLLVQRNQPLSEELKLQLAQVIEYAARRITELRQAPEAPTAPITPQAPELEPGAFPSSNINSFKYDPRSQRLFVKFHGKDTAGSGPTYSYEGVPNFIFDVFKRGAVGPKTTGKNKYHAWFKGVTPSLGAAMHALIKNGGFPYAQVA